MSEAMLEQLYKTLYDRAWDHLLSEDGGEGPTYDRLREAAEDLAEVLEEERK